MAHANIYSFERLLKDLENHIEYLNCFLQKSSNIASDVRGLYKFIGETARYDLLRDLENKIENLKFLFQQVFVVANNACITNTAINEAFKNWRRDLDQL